MIYCLFFLSLSTDPLDINQAKELIDNLYNVETDLLSHLDNLQDFATRFDFLLANDQKLKNKVHYIQYKSKLKSLKPEIIEVPLIIKPGIQIQDSLLKISNSTSFFQKLTSFDNHDKSFIFYPEKKIAAINNITFEETKFQNCLVRDFTVYFKSSDKHPENQLTDLTLYLNQTLQFYEFPSHVLFESLIIEPHSFWGNDTNICIPQIHVYGDKNFNNKNFLIE
ncbi:hypothetical protein M9Y10_034843 [Tritrichomonas musculus]|uniref:SUN domain-containing protein n=1 Tax=Tritrichomonas musculus TaxID=1915356 RepID=A0ABR2KG34_9EUKA